MRKGQLSQRNGKSSNSKSNSFGRFAKTGGLWSSKNQTESELTKRPLRKHKIVLKTQLSSRRKLLNQSHQNMTL